MSDSTKKFDLSKPNPEDEGEMITVKFCEQLITPTQYNQVRFGDISFSTRIRKNETPEDAYNRAWNFVESMAREQYKKAVGVFWDAYQTRATGAPKDWK